LIRVENFLLSEIQHNIETVFNLTCLKVWCETMKGFKIEFVSDCKSLSGCDKETE